MSDGPPELRLVVANSPPNRFQIIVSMEEILFWSEKVVEQPVSVLVEQEMFDAFEGQVDEHLDMSQGFGGDGMEVEVQE